jgi:hypothetical protein
MDPQGNVQAPSPAQPPPQRGRSAWGWVGCGCGILVLLAALVAGGVVFLLHRQVGETAGLNDPAAVAKKAQEVIPYHRLPQGIRPVSTLSIPFVMEIAIFADRDLQKGGLATRTFPTGTHSFMYIKTLNLIGAGTTESESRRLLSPHRNDMPAWMQKFGFQVRRNQTLRTGTLEVAGHTVFYKAVRSSILTPRRNLATLMSMMVVECPGSRWTHTALWMAPDPAPEKPLDTTELAGTPADPKAIAELLDGFSLCGGS